METPLVTPAIGSKWMDFTHRDVWTVVRIHPNGTVTIINDEGYCCKTRVLEASFLVGAYESV